MKFEQISKQNISNYFSTLAQIHILKLHERIVFPRAIYLSEPNECYIISPLRCSLYQVLHSNQTGLELTLFCKLNILIKLAQTLNEFHTLQHKSLAHSHLSTHNVFVDFPNA